MESQDLVLVYIQLVSLGVILRLPLFPILDHNEVELQALRPVSEQTKRGTFILSLIT